MNLMTIQELLKEVKWSSYKGDRPGGQIVGMGMPNVTMTVEVLDLKISINMHRSQLKNKEQCLELLWKFCELNNIIFDEDIKRDQESSL